MDQETNAPPTLLFLVTEDWYFCSHRLPMARAARDQGWRILVATRFQKHRHCIEKEGFEAIPIRLRRRGETPLGMVLSIWDLFRIYRRFRPDLVHHVAMKPIVFGTIAALASRTPSILNAFAGFGYVFTTNTPKSLLIRPILTILFRLLFRWDKVNTVVQNSVDFETVARLSGQSKDRITLIPGSGVDTEIFSPDRDTGRPRAGHNSGSNPIQITMVSRMLTDKGVIELVEAARTLNSPNQQAVITLVGGTDPDNPASIPEEHLRQWTTEGHVRWLGARTEIAAIWQKSDIAVLPSYREGMPKSLLEAASCGCPIVTTDVPGCRDVIAEGKSGLLVPARNASALADALQRLIDDPDLRRKMANQGRKRVYTLFSNEIIADKIVSLYRSILERTGTLAKRTHG
ncbi:MAG: glycosyltransferase family 4 protein [Magnetococcales bacterium]|nr:glycosyltransferase family 4 protein [Magnetococcales bacterium]